MNQTTNLQALATQVPEDPTYFPQKLDLVRQSLLLVRFTPEAYRDASFLDDRILSPSSRGAWISIRDLDAALERPIASRPLHFIFHAGHVGSTLVSRLLEEAGGVLALREPLPLRTLAEAHDSLGAPEALLSGERFNHLLRQQIMLWRRGYPDTRMVIVKATSSAARIGPELLSHNPESKALYLHLQLEPYLATLLAGENSPLDLRGHGPERMRRLLRSGIEPQTPLHAMSLGEMAALAWTTERLSRQALEAAGGGRVLALDFDRLILAPELAIRAICTHFALAASDSYFNQIAASPVWRHYAKAPEHAYSPQLRAQLLAQARVQQSGELRRGLAWFDALAERHPILQQLQG